MKWKFWIRDKQEDSQLEQLQTGVSEVGEQVNKLTRLQYKTNQEMLGKLDRLGSNLDSVLSWTSSLDEAKVKLEGIERRQHMTAESLIGILDEIDHVLAELNGHEAGAWSGLLLNWARQLQSTLGSLGVHEVQLLGRSFDPAYAESIQAVSRGDERNSAAGNTKGYVAYEVIEVVRRGYILQDGSLLRKAQVVTIKEEDSSYV